MTEQGNSRPQYGIIDELKKLIDGSEMPDAVKEKVSAILDDVTRAGSETPEYARTLEYIKFVSSLPWNSSPHDFPDHQSIQRKLDESLVGLMEEKDKLVNCLLSRVKTPNIMVVDDEKIALRNIERALSKEGYNVVPANNGAEAIEKLKDRQFDVVITDLIMGDVDGHEVIRETRKKYPDTKVIMVTGYATVDTAVEAIRMGAFHYIEKPLKLGEVRAVVKDALRKKLPSEEKKVICITGSSDEKKMAICRSIAEALGIETMKIPVSDINVTNELLGKSIDEGATPGLALRELHAAGTDRVLCVIEGIDKTDVHAGLSSAIAEMIDPDRNGTYLDRYLDMPYDLSRIIFVTTAESVDNISDDMREKVEVVKC